MSVIFKAETSTGLYTLEVCRETNGSYSITRSKKGEIYFHKTKMTENEAHNETLMTIRQAKLFDGVIFPVLVNLLSWRA